MELDEDRIVRHQSTELWEAGALGVVEFESILELLTGVGGTSETAPAPHLPEGLGSSRPDGNWVDNASTIGLQIYLFPASLLHSLNGIYWGHLH